MDSSMLEEPFDDTPITPSYSIAMTYDHHDKVVFAKSQSFQRGEHYVRYYCS